jgi:hypothetical protein
MHTSHPAPFGRRAAIEPLERRTLLSGTWTTVDTVPAPDSQNYHVSAMAADSAGNVYAAGPWGSNGFLIREKLAGSSDFIDVPATLPAPPAGTIRTEVSSVPCVATDPQGDAFLNVNLNYFDGTGYTGKGVAVLERRAGQGAFVPVEVTLPSAATAGWGGSTSFAVDSAGDVYFTSQILVKTRWPDIVYGGKGLYSVASYSELFEMKAGQTSFSPVYQFTGMSANGITVIDSGPSAGIYVAGESLGAHAQAVGTWTVAKSTDGGASWTTVDSLTDSQYDPNAAAYIPNGGMWVNALASDSSGNGHVFVVGHGTKFVLTGYTYRKVKGKIVASPSGYYDTYWLTRESDDGGATWATVENIAPAVSGECYEPYAIADLGGTVYVAGGPLQGSYLGHAIVRANAGGTWHTADDYQRPTDGDAFGSYYAVTIDPTTGTPYAGGSDRSKAASGLVTYGWLIRSGPALAAAAAANSFSSMAVVANHVEGDSLPGEPSVSDEVLA